MYKMESLEKYLRYACNEKSLRIVDKIMDEYKAGEIEEEQARARLFTMYRKIDKYKKDEL